MMEKAQLVTLQPNSRTNPSDKFRVADYDEWIKYYNGDTDTYDFVEYETYEEAQDARQKYGGPHLP